MPNQLYSENLGNALGTGLAQGVNAFTQRSDQLDQKNYDRGQAALGQKKQDAQLLYNHLKDLTSRFADIQSKGGQQGMSDLEIAQASEANNKAQKIMGMLTSGKYAEANQAFGDFQNHMSTVAGPAPTDGQGAPVAGPPVPQAQQLSGEDLLNTQASQGNQNLGSLAYRGTSAQTTNLENQAATSTMTVQQMRDTLQKSTDLINSNADLGLKKNEVYTRLLGLSEASDKATYLAGIAKIGAAGVNIIQGLDPDVVPQSMKDAAIHTAMNVQTQDDNSTAATGLANDMTTFQLGDLKTKAPLTYTAMLLSNIGAMKDNDLKDLNIEQATTDVEKGKAELASYKTDSPLQHSLLVAQVGTAQSNLAVIQAVQRSEIDVQQARNFSEIAKSGKVDSAYWDNLGKEINPATGKPYLTPALVQSYKDLTTYADQTNSAQLQILQGNAVTSQVAGRVATATEKDQVTGFKADVRGKVSQAGMLATDAAYRDRSDALGIQGQRADLTGKQEANFNAHVQNQYADPLARATLANTQATTKINQATAAVAPQMAQAGLVSAQSKATSDKVAAAFAGRRTLAEVTLAEAQGKSADYQAIYDGASLSDKIAGSHVQLQQQRTNLDSSLVALKLDKSTVGLKIEGMKLGNLQTVAQINTAHQQLLDMKQAYIQQGKKDPKELAAMDAALAVTNAQLLSLAGTAQTPKERTNVLNGLQSTLSSTRKAHLVELASFFKNNGLAGKIAVDQFDPTNYVKIFPSLNPAAQGDLKVIAGKLIQDDKDMSELASQYKALSKDSNTGGTDWGVNAPASGLPASEINKQIGLMFNDPEHGLMVKLAAAKRNGNGDWFSDSGPLRAYNGYGKDGTGQWMNPSYVGDIKAMATGKPWIKALQDSTGSRHTELAQINAGIEAAAKKNGVPPDIAKAIAWKESMGWQPGLTSSDGKGGGLGQTTGYFPPDVGTPETASAKTNGQTTTPPPSGNQASSTTPPPVPAQPAGNPGTVYKSSTGGNYVSHTLSGPQMKLLDANGFFSRVKQITTVAERDQLLAEYGQLLYGGGSSQSAYPQLNDLMRQIAAAGK